MESNFKSLLKIKTKLIFYLSTLITCFIWTLFLHLPNSSFKNVIHVSIMWAACIIFRGLQNRFCLYFFLIQNQILLKYSRNITMISYKPWSLQDLKKYQILNIFVYSWCPPHFDICLQYSFKVLFAVFLFHLQHVCVRNTFKSKFSYLLFIVFVMHTFNIKM